MLLNLEFLSCGEMKKNDLRELHSGLYTFSSSFAEIVTGVLT
jgi:hypothetical protein